MTTADKHREARERVAEQRARALAARPTDTPATPYRSPRATPHDVRPNALATAPPPLLSRDDLRQYFGITYSRSHLWRLIKDGTFPAPVALGPAPYARKCWRLADIEAWIAALPVVGGEAA